MKKTKFTAAVLSVLIIFAGLMLAQTEDEARKIYEQAQKLFIQKNYQQAIEQYNKILQDYAQSRYADDSMYWVGYSTYALTKSIENIEQQLEGKEKAIEYMNKLISSFADSLWIDDAQQLRIEIAEDLVKKGYDNYRAYIDGSLMGLRGMESLGSLKSLESLKNLKVLEDLDSNYIVLGGQEKGE